MENVITIVKKRCNDAGLSFHRLCRLADVPRDTILRWESREPKSIKLLRKIAEHFEIDDVLEVIPFLQKWSEQNSIHALSKELEINYRNIQNWIKWKGSPKSIVLLNKINLTLKNYGQESKKKE